MTRLPESSVRSRAAAPGGVIACQISTAVRVECIWGTRGLFEREQAK